MNRRTLLKLTGAIALFDGFFDWSGPSIRLDGIYGVGIDGTPLAMGAESVSLSGLPTLSQTSGRHRDDVQTGVIADGVETYAFETVTGQSLELETTGDVAVAIYDTSGELLDMVSPVADGPLTIPESTSGIHIVQVASAGTATEPYALALVAASSTTTLPIEAETAEGGDDFSPLEVRTADAASGGEYIVAPDEGRNNFTDPPSEGYATYTIDLPEDDDYVVWARAYGRSNGNSFYGRLNGGRWHEVHFKRNTWNWRRLGDTSPENQNGGTTFSLSSGTHSLELAYREDDCRLDKLVVTNDMEFIPTGTGPTANNVEPDASISIGSTSVETETDVTFDGSKSSDPDGSIASYKWTFGDGTSATGKSVTHSYEAAGEYTATLTVTDDDGATATATKLMTVWAPPVADAGDDKTVKADTSVTLDASGSSDPNGDALSYTWTQMDGPSVSLSDATAQQPTFSCPAISETTTLTFEVEVANGQTSTTDTANVTVQPELRPIGHFENAPTDPDNDGRFEDVNGDGRMDISDVQAFFSNSNDPVVQNNVPKFDFNGDGNMNIADTQRLFAFITGSVTNTKPTATISVSPTSVETETDVTFDGSKSSDPDGSIASYKWTFGDGTSATGKSVTHSYESAGEYTATLTVTDDDGATDTTSRIITVTPSQEPYRGTVRDVTDTIEAEHFDTGGEGVAYSDTDAANKGGEFRPDQAVDIESRTDDYNLSWLEDGEWLEYTVDVPTAGTYEVIARVASANSGGTLRVKLDDTTLGTIDVPVTGGWETWTTASLTKASIDAGRSRVLRLEVVDSGFDLDWIVFNPSANVPPTATTGVDRTVTDSDDSGMETVTLDGSASLDADGTITDYSWRENGTEIATGEVTDVSLATGSHEITLVVTDDDGATDSDTVTITVSDAVEITGTLKEWHKVTLAFEGPDTSESADPNPFLDYRLDVTFEGPSGQTYEVPGYYAADGTAADSGATSGSTWHAHLAPDEAGEWSYKVTFTKGDRVAVNGGGRPTAFDDAEGTFTVAASDKSGRDFRAHGALQAVGDHYLQFAGSEEHFLKIGADSSENFLGYADFDQTYANGSRPQGGLDSFIHEYEPHIDDWNEGDPTWRDEQGKGIIGAINYLSNKGVNSHYFLTYNIDGGDGSDVWPWTSPDERRRFDVSKLAQWERLFEHMTRKGVMLHVVTQETENDQALNGGSLGIERKLYYRELIARFGHHPAITWNLGEENTNSDAQRSAFIDFFEETDPYDSFICVHTYPGSKEDVYGDLLGRDDFDGTSLQTSYSPRGDVLEWRRKSAQAGRPWVVMVDETGTPSCGIPADGNTCNVTQDEARRDTLWGTLMAGAGGVEWFFGYQSVGGDLGLEDYRSRDQWWDYNRYAHDLLIDLPLTEMEPADERLANAGTEAHCLVHENDDVAVVYLHQSASVDIDLSGTTYALRWLNPKTGDETDAGTIDSSGMVEITEPPFDGDAVAVLDRQ